MTSPSSQDSFTDISATCSSVNSLSPLFSPFSSSSSQTNNNHTILSNFIQRLNTPSAILNTPPPTTPFRDCTTPYSTKLLNRQSSARPSRRRSRSARHPASSRHSSTTGNNADSTTTTTDQNSLYIAALFSNRSSIGGQFLDAGNQTDCDIGLCLLDLISTKCIVSQFFETQSLSRTLNKLHVYPPTQILVPSTYYHPDKSEIAVLLESNLDPSTEIIPISPSRFSSNVGFSLIKSLGWSEHAQFLESTLASKFLALASVAALFAHIEADRHLTFVQGGVRFVYESTAGVMVVGAMTARDLELVHSQASINSPSLFSVLNRCLTSMGTRLLRNSILQPPCISEVIQARHSAVDQLFNAPDVVQTIVDQLGHFPNLDRIISGFIHISRINTVKSSELDLARILDLRKTLAALPMLRTALQQFTHPILVDAHTHVAQPTLDEMNNAISQWIEDDLDVSQTPIGTRNRRAFALKSGMHGLLDVSRKMYSDTVSDIMSLVNDYSAQYGLPLKCIFSPATGGFAIEIKSSQLEFPMMSLNDGSSTAGDGSSESGILPKVFVNLVHKRGLVQFTTLDIMKLNERVRESMAEIYLISDRILQDLMEQLRSLIGCLYTVSESIAMVDMLCCFARLRMTQSYVRPLLSVGMTVVSESRHPILEAVFKRDAGSAKSRNRQSQNSISASRRPVDESTGSINRRSVVPNDMYLDIGCNVQVVSGANGVGKTVYLKQVALITIMAHIGCPVPATNAVVRITHQIMSRMSSGDAMLANQSSFTVEMREAAHILEEVKRGYERVLGDTSETGQGNRNTMTELEYSALVIIDELGRGTAPLEAVGLAFSIVEALAHTHVFVVFATHFHDLFTQLQVYPNIVHLHFDMNVTVKDNPSPSEGDVVQKQLAYTYKIQDGLSSTPFGYGLQLAAAVGFPESVMVLANHVADKMWANRAGRRAGNESSCATEIAWRKAFHEVLRRAVAIQMNPYLAHDDQILGLLALQAEMRPMFPGGANGGADGVESDSHEQAII